MEDVKKGNDVVRNVESIFSLKIVLNFIKEAVFITWKMFNKLYVQRRNTK